VTERHEDDDTPLPEVGGRSGRFWHRAWQSTRFRWMVGLSLAAHSLLTPWRILPTTSLEYRDVDGELEILAGVYDEAPPAPEPEPTPPAPAPGIGCSRM
jgi:hypothetical protein